MTLTTYVKVIGERGSLKIYKYIKKGLKEFISEECKKAHQSLHQLSGYTENSLFSYECNKTNKINVSTL